METAALLLLFCLGGEPIVVTDQCETIEYQTYYDDKAEVVFRQYIFLDDDRTRLQIVDWRLEKGQKPYWHAGKWKLTWHDGTCLRRVIANELRITHSQTDHELLQRIVLPKELRRELSKPLTKNARQR